MGSGASTISKQDRASRKWSWRARSSATVAVTNESDQGNLEIQSTICGENNIVRNSTLGSSSSLQDSEEVGMETRLLEQNRSSPNQSNHSSSPLAYLFGSRGSNQSSPSFQENWINERAQQSNVPSFINEHVSRTESDTVRNDETAEMFMQMAMSLGMDQDDLLFNMMYFEELQLQQRPDGSSQGYQMPSLSQLLNSVQQETVALHSENNTPYKLKPASDDAIAGLVRITIDRFRQINQDCECAICKCDMEKDEPCLQIPACRHIFHEECLLRWIKLVSSQQFSILFL